MKLRIDSIEELREFLSLMSKHQPETAKEANEFLQAVECHKRVTGENIAAQVEETLETDVDQSEETLETDVDQSEETLETDVDQSEETPETDVDQSEETPETDVDGVEWDPAVHSMGRTKTKEGRWRVKKGLVPVDESKLDDFAVQVKKKYISKLEEGDLSIEEMMDIFDENGLLSIDDIEKQPQEILELLNKAI